MAKVRFDLQSGDVIESDEWTPIQGRQLVVNQPSEAVLEVSLLPSGNGWADVWMKGHFAWEYKGQGKSLHATPAL